MWSYTVKGMPVGSATLGPGGRVYVTTKAKRLYALTSDGHLAWTKKTRSRPLTGAIALGDSLVAYAASDGQVRCLSSGGEPVWNRYVGGVEAIAPGQADLLGVTTRGGKLWWLSDNHMYSASLPARADQGLASVEGAWIVGADDHVLAFTPQKKTPRW